MHITLTLPQLKSYLIEILDQKNYTLGVDDRAKLKAALDLLHDTEEDDHSMEHAECETSLAKRFSDSSEKNKKVPVLWRDVLLKAADVLSKVNESSALTMNSISFEIEMTENLRDPITLEDMVLPVALSCGHAYAVASLEYLQKCISCGYTSADGPKLHNQQIHFLPQGAIETLFYPIDNQSGAIVQYKNQVMRALVMHSQGCEFLVRRLKLYLNITEEGWLNYFDYYRDDPLFIGLLLFHAHSDLLFKIFNTHPELATGNLIDSIKKVCIERSALIYKGLAAFTKEQQKVAQTAVVLMLPAAILSPILYFFFPFQSKNVKLIIGLYFFLAILFCYMIVRNLYTWRQMKQEAMKYTEYSKALDALSATSSATFFFPSASKNKSEEDGQPPAKSLPSIRNPMT